MESWLYVQNSVNGGFTSRYFVLTPFCGLRFYHSPPTSARRTSPSISSPESHVILPTLNKMQRILIMPEGWIFGGDIEIVAVQNEPGLVRFGERPGDDLFSFVVFLRSFLRKKKYVIRFLAERPSIRESWYEALSRTMISQRYIRSCRECGALPSSTSLKLITYSNFSDIRLFGRTLTIPMLGSIVMFCKLHQQTISARMTTLHIEAASLADSHMEILVNMLDSARNLMELSLARNRLTCTAIQTLVQSLYTSSSATADQPFELRRLNLSSNYISDNGTTFLAGALNSVWKKLVSINLSHNAVGSVGAISLCRALSLSSCRVCQLDMSYNSSIGDIAGSVIALLLSLSPPRFRSLDFSFVNLSDVGCAHIIPQIANCRTLIDIDLRGNLLSEESVAQLLKSVNAHHSIIYTKYDPAGRVVPSGGFIPYDAKVSRLVGKFGGCGGSGCGGALMARALRDGLTYLEDSSILGTVTIKRLSLLDSTDDHVRSREMIDPLSKPRKLHVIIRACLPRHILSPDEFVQQLTFLLEAVDGQICIMSSLALDKKENAPGSRRKFSYPSRHWIFHIKISDPSHEMRLQSMSKRARKRIMSFRYIEPGKGPSSGVDDEDEELKIYYQVPLADEMLTILTEMIADSDPKIQSLGIEAIFVPRQLPLHPRFDALGAKYKEKKLKASRGRGSTSTPVQSDDEGDAENRRSPVFADDSKSKSGKSIKLETEKLNDKTGEKAKTSLSAAAEAAKNAAKSLTVKPMRIRSQVLMSYPSSYPEYLPPMTSESFVDNQRLQRIMEGYAVILDEEKDAILKASEVLSKDASFSNIGTGRSDGKPPGHRHERILSGMSDAIDLADLEAPSDNEDDLPPPAIDSDNDSSRSGNSRPASSTRSPNLPESSSKPSSAVTADGTRKSLNILGAVALDAAVKESRPSRSVAFKADAAPADDEDNDDDDDEDEDIGPPQAGISPVVTKKPVLKHTMSDSDDEPQSPQMDFDADDDDNQRATRGRTESLDDFFAETDRSGVPEFGHQESLKSSSGESDYEMEESVVRPSIGQGTAAKSINDTLTIATQKLVREGKLTEVESQFWIRLFSASLSTGIPEVDATRKQTMAEELRKHLTPNGLFPAVERRKAIVDAMFSRGTVELENATFIVRETDTEGGMALEYGQTLLNNLLQQQLDAALVFASVQSAEQLPLVDSFLLKCAKYGYAGSEAYQAIQVRECLVGWAARDANEDAQAALMLIQVRAWLGNLLISRDIVGLKSALDQLKEERNNPMTPYPLPITDEEKLGIEFMKEIAKSEEGMREAIASGQLTKLEDALAHAGYLNHYSDLSSKCASLLIEKAGNAIGLVVDVACSIRDADMLKLRSVLLEIKRVGYDVPGLSTAEVLMSERNLLIQQDIVRNKLISAAKAILSNKVSGADAAELVPLLKRVKTVGLERDKKLYKDIAVVTKYINKMSGRATEEETLLNLLNARDVIGLEEMLEGRSDKTMLMAADSDTDLTSWIEAIRAVAKGQDEFTCLKAEVHGKYVKQGKLQKYARSQHGGGGLKGWKTRYFILKGSELTYYSGKGKEKKGSARVRGGLVTLVDDTSLFGNRPNMFELREGKDLSKIDPDLLAESRRQLKILQQEDAEETIAKCLSAGNQSVDFSSLMMTLERVQSLKLVIDEDLKVRAKALVLKNEGNILKSQLTDAVALLNRQILIPLVARAELVKLDPHFSALVRAKYLLTCSDAEVLLMNMRRAMTRFDQPVYENCLTDLQSVRNKLTSREKEMMIAIRMEHGVKKVIQTSFMGEESMFAAAKNLRQIISQGNSLGVETSAMVLARVASGEMGPQAAGADAASTSDALIRQMTSKHLDSGKGHEEASSGVMDRRVLTTLANVYSLQRFPDLRGVEEFAKKSGGLLSRKKTVSREELMSHSIEPLTRSLCVNISHSGESACNEAFVWLVTVMGDLKSETSGLAQPLRGRSSKADVFAAGLANEASTVDPSVLIHRLCELATSSKEIGIRDELYLQVCKQLVGNSRPQSRVRGWLVMAMYLHHFNPSGTLLPYLRQHIYNLLLSEESMDDVDGIAAQQTSPQSPRIGGVVQLSTVGGGIQQIYPRKLANYCMNTIFSMTDFNPDLTLYPRFATISSAYEQRPFNIEIHLMSGHAVQVPAVIIAMQTGFPLLAGLQESLKHPVERVMSDIFDVSAPMPQAVSSPRASLSLATQSSTSFSENMAIYSNEACRVHATLQTWRGFSLYLVDTREQGEDVRDFPIQPSESQVVDWDSNIVWKIVAAKSKSKAEKGEAVDPRRLQRSKSIRGEEDNLEEESPYWLVLRRRIGLRSERALEKLNPPVMLHERFEQDSIIKKKLWHEWLSFEGGNAAAPSDDLRIKLLFAEESRYVNSRLYVGSDESNAYLAALHVVVDFPKEKFAGEFFDQVDSAKSDVVTIEEALDELGISITDVEVLESVKTTIRGIHAAGVAANVERTSNRFKYFLRRAYLSYVRMWPLYGCHFFEVMLRANAIIAMPKKLVLAVNADGIFLLTGDWRTLLQCRLADLEKVDATSRPNMLLLSINGMPIDLETSSCRDISSIIRAACLEVLRVGDFEHGSGIGSAEEEYGSLEQVEMIKQYLKEFVILPPPPPPPMLIPDDNMFAPPKSRRQLIAKERSGQEAAAREEGRKASDEAARKEQEYMEMQKRKLLDEAKDEDDDDEKHKHKHTSSSTAPTSTKRHNTNPAVCGVSSRFSKLKYNVPAPPEPMYKRIQKIKDKREHGGTSAADKAKQQQILGSPPQLLVDSARPSVRHPSELPKASLQWPAEEPTDGHDKPTEEYNFKFDVVKEHELKKFIAVTKQEEVKVTHFAAVSEFTSIASLQDPELPPMDELPPPQVDFADSVDFDLLYADPYSIQPAQTTESEKMQMSKFYFMTEENTQADDDDDLFASSRNRNSISQGAATSGGMSDDNIMGMMKSMYGTAGSSKSSAQSSSAAKPSQKQSQPTKAQAPASQLPDVYDDEDFTSPFGQPPSMPPVQMQPPKAQPFSNPPPMPQDDDEDFTSPFGQPPSMPPVQMQPPVTQPLRTQAVSSHPPMVQQFSSPPATAYDDDDFMSMLGAHSSAKSSSYNRQSSTFNAVFQQEMNTNTGNYVSPFATAVDDNKSVSISSSASPTTAAKQAKIAKPPTWKK